MGLDQYIYRVKRVTREMLGDLADKKVLSAKDKEALEEKGIHFYEEDFLEEHPSLKSWVTKLIVNDSFIDLVKLFESHFPEHKGEADCWRVCGFGIGDTVRYSFIREVPGESNQIVECEMTWEDYESFGYLDNATYYVLCRDDQEVAYWRKNYNLQHWMRHGGWNYEGNCVYKPLNREVVENLIADLKAFMKDRSNAELEEKFDYMVEVNQDPQDVWSDEAIQYTLEVFESLLDLIEEDPNTLYCYYEWY